MQRLRTGSGDAAKITSRLPAIGILAIRRMAMLTYKIPKGSRREGVTNNSWELFTWVPDCYTELTQTLVSEFTLRVAE
jgi:hypothetical protein